MSYFLINLFMLSSLTHVTLLSRTKTCYAAKRSAASHPRPHIGKKMWAYGWDVGWAVTSGTVQREVSVYRSIVILTRLTPH